MGQATQPAISQPGAGCLELPGRGTHRGVLLRSLLAHFMWSGWWVRPPGQPGHSETRALKQMAAAADS